MASPLLTSGQLAAVQKVAISGMQSPVTISRRTGDVGLDLTDDPYGSTVSYAPVVSSSQVLGWLHSTPTPVQQVDSGAIITVNTYRLFVPVGTDILPGDQATIGGNTYVVSDTTVDETWPALLACSLRLRE